MAEPRWSESEREKAFETKQEIMRAIHKSPVKLTQPIQDEATIELAAQRNLLLKTLESIRATLLAAGGGPMPTLAAVLAKVRDNGGPN